MCRAKKQSATKEVFFRKNLDVRLANAKYRHAIELTLDPFSKTITSFEVVRLPSTGGRYA